MDNCRIVASFYHKIFVFAFDEINGFLLNRDGGGGFYCTAEGDVSAAFVTTDVNGNVISKIVKMLQIIPTHSATLADDYLTIEEMALTEKRNEVFDKWSKEKIDGIYVYIDPEFREGEFEYPNWVK